MITILHRGEGSLRTPKSDYVICARPLQAKQTLALTEYFNLIFANIFKKDNSWNWLRIAPAKLKVHAKPTSCKNLYFEN